MREPHAPLEFGGQDLVLTHDRDRLSGLDDPHLDETVRHQTHHGYCPNRRAQQNPTANPLIALRSDDVPPI